jgi:hypothetical protein
MPLHDFLCRNGHVSEMMVPFGTESIPCPLCLAHVDIQAEKVFLRAPMSFVREDVCYESPIDGRLVTSYQQHLEDLARNDCVLYESGIKQDQERNERMREEALERSVEETVDREIALMPAAKKEKLAAELEGGLTATPERITPPQSSRSGALGN